MLLRKINTYMIESNVNIAILKSKKLLILLNFEWDKKLYILHVKSDGIGTTLKLLETINGNVKILSKMIEN